MARNDLGVHLRAAAGACCRQGVSILTKTLGERFQSLDVGGIGAISDMLAAVNRPVVVIAVMLGVAFSPVALDACVMSCQASTTPLAATHHACHAGGTPRVSYRARTCGHDHGVAPDGIISPDQISATRLRSTVSAAQCLTIEHVTLAQITRVNSPPRSEASLTLVASSAVPLRV
jgi:hypothetical protein